jgi:Fe-S cluster biosynthesis and repair protein YggX
MERAVYPGALGEAILAGTCRDCWNEWREMEVRVINELKLNFIEPEAQETLTRHLVQFLGLATVSSGTQIGASEGQTLDTADRVDEDEP